jgi:CheY-like chemotaxis protein
MQNGELNILIVDDDREDISIAEGVLREGLQGVPIELDKANSFAQDLQRIEKGRYDLFLFDYQLGEKMVWI